MASRSTLAALAQELTDALDPLILAFESADAFEGFMRVLGWTTTGVIQPVQDLASLVTGAKELIADGSIDASQVGELVGRLKRAYDGIRALSSVSAGSLGPSIDVAEFQADFPGQLLDYIVVDYLQHRRPKIGRLLQLFGVIREREIAKTATRPPYVRREVYWHAFAQALKDPRGPFRDAYAYGTNDFDGTTFLDVVFELARGHGMDVRIGILSAAERAFLRDGAVPADVGLIHNSGIRWVVAENPFEAPPISVGLEVAVTPATVAIAPTTGPISAPKTAAPIVVPISAPRRSRGAAATSHASAPAQESALPIPCRSRAAPRAHASSANAKTKLATAVTDTPTSAARCGPKRAATSPLGRDAISTPAAYAAESTPADPFDSP